MARKMLPESYSIAFEPVDCSDSEYRLIAVVKRRRDSMLVAHLQTIVRDTVAATLHSSSLEDRRRMMVGEVRVCEYA